MTVNLVNDLFEAAHPNRDRHAVWDGWAVRKETAPDAGHRASRAARCCIRRSHLFFALRKWWHARDTIDERGVASEGTLAATSSRAARDVERAARRARREDERAHAPRRRRVGASSEDADQAGRQHDRRRATTEVARRRRRYVRLRSIAAGSARTPATSSRDNLGEEVAPVVATADDDPRAAVEVRAQLRKQLAEWAKAHTRRGRQADARARARRPRPGARRSCRELDVQKLAGRARAAARRATSATSSSSSRRAGARLVVVVLPIDVQVSADEWKKYGATPIDMAPTPGAHRRARRARAARSACRRSTRRRCSPPPSRARSSTRTST